MATRGVVVAIDGPSGSGKSSVSREVAARLGFGYLDTGAMYRALTVVCLEAEIDLNEQDTVTEVTNGIRLRMGTDPDEPTVAIVTPVGLTYDRTEQIRRPEVAAAVSAVATNLAVRARLRDEQRQIITDVCRGGRGIVVEGRDITTVVAPDADVRLLLTASEQARLSRRAAQNAASGAAQDDTATRDQVVRRDADDATVSQFLTAADGVVTLDSSALTFDETVQAVIGLITPTVEATDG